MAKSSVMHNLRKLLAGFHQGLQFGVVDSGVDDFFLVEGDFS